MQIAHYAPFDIRLPRKSKRDEDIITVVQPDIFVLCDPSKIDKRSCLGAPDIVVEILSPGNNRTEMQKKYELYQGAGIREYWVVSPEERVIFRHVLNYNGWYFTSGPMAPGEIVTTPILPGFALDLNQVFKNGW